MDRPGCPGTPCWPGIPRSPCKVGKRLRILFKLVHILTIRLLPTVCKKNFVALLKGRVNVRVNRFKIEYMEQ